MSYDLSIKNAPRWFILIADVLISAASIGLAFLIRFDFDIQHHDITYLQIALPVVIIIRLATFLGFKSYQGVIRYTESADIQRLFLVLFVGSCALFILNLIPKIIHVRFNIPRSIIIIDFMTSMFLMVLFRLTTKKFYEQIKYSTKNKASVLIVGAGEFAMIAKRALDRDAGTKYTVDAFVDCTKSRVGKKIEGIGIISDENLAEYFPGREIHHIILADLGLSKKRKQEIIDIALQFHVRVFDVPPADSWINGELSFKQIKKIKIEDLLEREQIVLDVNKINAVNKDQVILVTGAAGSIGSELVRQLAPFQPKQILLLDQAESPLYELELELNEFYKSLNFKIVVADISNQERVEYIFDKYKPDIVYHAAAYKHVPMMEKNPNEAINVNVKGTKILANTAVKHNVKRFVMVSTDKAVNPTNVMGASKRIAEIYIQSLNNTSETNFVTTRFGNVLGSNGSVIPLFRKQIEAGGPITVTHPEVTRFFMTIPEACQLVMEAGAMGRGGEIFIFDMGNSVKIVDLAKKMIRLSRLELDKDIKIIYTGMRPGEKLYEELLTTGENTIKTHHPKIMIAQVRLYDYQEVKNDIQDLIDSGNELGSKEIVKKMKSIVPEYKSENSVFSELDN